MTYLFVNNELPPVTKQQTIGVEYYGKTIVFGMIDKKTRQPVNKSMRISFYDTAGQEKYDAITTAHYRKSMGALVVYAVSDRASFTSVEKWINQIKENAGPNCSIVLVANKTDLDQTEWQVSQEEGQNMAEKHGIEFFEVSTLNNTGIDDTMNGLARLMCIKWESLAGSFTPGFNDPHIITPRIEPNGFKLGAGGGGGFGCCTSRSEGPDGKKGSSCC